MMKEEIKDNGVVKFSFYLFGIGGLLAWNTILSILDFFIHFQGDYSPQFVYTNMNFVLNLVFQFVLLLTKKNITWKTQIFGSMVISVFSMIGLPISVIYMSGMTSFLVTSTIILLQGLANAIILSCLYGIISFLPFEYIIAFSTGQGIAGVLMNVTRYIILWSLGDPELESNIVTGSIIFFSISAMIILLCIVFLFIVYKNPYFIYKLRSSGEFTEAECADFPQLNEDSNESNNNFVNANENFSDNSKQVEESKQHVTSSSSSFKTLMNLLLDLNFIIVINFIITFAVFPGVSLAQPLFDLNSSFRTNTIITIFNVFDTVGRKFPVLLPLKKTGLYVITFLRFIFIFSFPLVVGMAKNDFIGTELLSAFTIMNMVLFAFTSGYLVSTCFSLAPEQVPNELKGKSGSSLSFFLIIGIFSGSLFATFVMQNFI